MERERCWLMCWCRFTRSGSLTRGGRGGRERGGEGRGGERGWASERGAARRRAERNDGGGGAFPRPRMATERRRNAAPRHAPGLGGVGDGTAGARAKGSPRGRVVSNQGRRGSAHHLGLPGVLHRGRGARLKSQGGRRPPAELGRPLRNTVGPPVLLRSHRESKPYCSFGYYKSSCVCNTPALFH